MGTGLDVIRPSKCRTRTNRIERQPMKKPDRKKQQKDLARGKRKAAKELAKKRRGKLKKDARLAENIKERKAKRETFKLEQEVKKLQNKGNTYRKPKEEEV